MINTQMSKDRGSGLWQLKHRTAIIRLECIMTVDREREGSLVVRLITGEVIFLDSEEGAALWSQLQSATINNGGA